MKERIGFVGLGNMGHGMAKNIVDKGWPLTVLGHRRREAVDDLKRRGASEAVSALALAAESDVVVLCVTGSPQVEARNSWGSHIKGKLFATRVNRQSKIGNRK